MNEKKGSKIFVLILAGILVLAGFIIAVNMQKKIASGSEIYDIKNFDSYEDLTTFLATGNQNSGRYFETYNAILSPSAVDLDFAEEKSSVATQEDGNTYTQDNGQQGGTEIDYSKTNVQVEGVDEPDIVKTDGTYLYMVSNNKVIIVKAYPAQEAVKLSQSQIEFNESSTVLNIFIDDSRLVIFLQTYDYPILKNAIAEEDKINYWYSSPDTYVKIYDLEDISNPVLIKDIVVGGSFSGARLIGDYIYVITTQYSYSTDENYTIKPQLMINGEVLETPLNDIYYVDIPEKSSTFTNIISINIHDDAEEVHQKIFLLGSTQTLYVSENNIYVSYFSSSTWYYDYSSFETILEEKLLPLLPDSAKAQIDTIKDLDLDDYQKQTVTQWIIQNNVDSLSDEQKSDIIEDIAKETEKTIIHRISINNGEINYEAQGSIVGYVNNQFSLSENNGYLYVSSTFQGSSISYYIGGNIEPKNNVYVLNLNLTLVGSVENIAPGETIYATRFVGDICYLVTFEQTDPFFVIDLSDPENPQILGELKIPGFSTYLHPYDETHMIGIGRDKSRVKISLFDVTDMNNPIELYNYTIENEDDTEQWTESSALYEHKAFLFDKEKNLLVIPAGPYYKQVAYVFDITLDDISLKGKVSHDLEIETPEEYKDEEPYYSWLYYYDDGNSIQRTLFIEDILYTISENMVKMNSLENLNDINSVNLI